MSRSRYRIRTTKAEIARYWLGTAEGEERLPDNCAFDAVDEPSCFACGFDARRANVTSEGWLRWNAASLDRCHLVPRQLGGNESPANLVLLCSRCHRDAPNVGDPDYMLRWIGERENYITATLALISTTLERAGLSDTFERFTDSQNDAFNRLFNDLLRRWTGLHGMYATDSTFEAVAIESVRRIAAGITDPDLKKS